jgi:tetratricopeptide (TPR) repeat protein
MVLSWGGVEVAPEALAPEVLTESRGGSLQSAILGAARRHGRVAYPLQDLDELLAELAAGHPVLVLQNLALRWYPVWHYAVAVGYDLERRRVFLRSGSEARREVRLATFEHTWARSGSWALAVLPPHELPAAADERRYLLAVTGLERTRRWPEAERAYARALERWPASLPAWIGLGGSRHAQGDLAGAEEAFRGATALDPQEASAYNNLAQVLIEQGRREEASRAIERALAIGGPLESVYRETQRRIEAPR